MYGLDIVGMDGLSAAIKVGKPTGSCTIPSRVWALRMQALSARLSRSLCRPAHSPTGLLRLMWISLHVVANLYGMRWKHPGTCAAGPIEQI